MLYTKTDVYIKNISRYYKYAVVSLNVCHDMGVRGAISTVTPSISVDSLRIKDFHRSTLKYITPAILTNLPEELTIFQAAMLSG